MVLAARSQEKSWTQIVPLNIMNWLLRHKEYEGVGMPHVSDRLPWRVGCLLRFACCLPEAGIKFIRSQALLPKGCLRQAA